MCKPSSTYKMRSAIGEFLEQQFFLRKRRDIEALRLGMFQNSQILSSFKE
jgi:hypothetical protein